MGYVGHHASAFGTLIDEEGYDEVGFTLAKHLSIPQEPSTLTIPIPVGWIFFMSATNALRPKLRQSIGPRSSTLDDRQFHRILTLEATHRILEESFLGDACRAVPVSEPSATANQNPHVPQFLSLE